MIHFLRDRYNNSIVDIDATKNDIRCVVCIKPYSQLLLETPPEHRDELISDFNYVQEIRGLYFENPRQDRTPDELAKSVCKIVAQRWSLGYVTD